MKRNLVYTLVVALVCSVPYFAQTKPTPKRINRAIELLESGQPIYYAQTNAGGYENGKKMAQTKADYITYEMEHGVFDFQALREFMRGLVDGGPTRTGHRTPAVVATLPVLGLDAASMRANSWVVQQALATGIHGILLCHADDPGAVKVFVESTRYPFAPKAVGLNQGWRGSGSQGYAAGIWGIPANDYLKKADPWPLNKEGEIMLGLKLEDPMATRNAPVSTKTPGIAFAEWGPGDNGFYLLGLPTGGGNNATAPAMVEARAKNFKAAKDAKIAFLNACNEATVIDQLKEGVMICTGGDSPAAEKGRQFTKRQGVW